MYGNNSMDERILAILNEHSVEDKFFIEAGANDGLSQSNTALLEFHHGWRGLCVEPNFINFERCVKNRPNSIVVHAALVSSSHEGSTIRGTFNDQSVTRANGLMSACNEGDIETFPGHVCEVPARTLTSILDEHGSPAIGFMSLDVENYELHALAGLDFERYRPKVILMEIGRWHTEGVTEKHMEFMIDKGYEFTSRMSDGDFLFIAK